MAANSVQVQAKPHLWQPTGPGRPIKTNWQADFLAYYLDHGTKFRAAQAVGVSRVTVDAELARNSAFAEAFRDAEEIFSDRLEEMLLHQGTGEGEGSQGTFVPLIVLLKKRRPAEFIERHATLNLTATVEDMDPEAQRILAGEMFKHLTPTSQNVLGETRGEVPEAVTPANPGQKALPVTSAVTAPQPAPDPSP